MSDFEERLNDVEIDVGYALGELKDLQGQINDSGVIERLEGIEARLAEITDKFNSMRPEVRGEPIGGYVRSE
jgi:uncharacterized coiled-coil protein SlyX